MSVARLAISFDRDLARRVRRAAGKQPTSAWLADAARRKLRADGLLSAIEDWEKEHGQITAEELAQASKARRQKKAT